MRVIHSKQLLSLCIALSCLLLVAVAVVTGWRLSREPSAALQTVEPTIAGLPSTPTALPGASEALVARSTPVSATPTPTAPPLPQWVQTLRKTALWSSPSSGYDIVEQLSEGIPLKLSSAQDQRFLVYYGGGGRDQPATEGWVDRTDVAPIGAPKWVTTRWETDLGLGQGGQKVDRVPGGAVLQVLEDRGTELRGFYLGDGQSQDTVEGWIKAPNLGAAGAMLRADSRGTKLLSQPEVAALRAGEGVWMKVPYRTQLDGSPAAEANCGPATIGMALDHFVGHFSTEELRDAANRLQGTRGPDNGFGIQYLAGLAQQYGLKAEELNAGNGLKRWNVDDLKSHITQGHLVIPELRFRLMPGRANSDTWDDHYVVITGMLGDDFIYNDSVDSDGPGYGRIMTSEGLTRAWGGSSFPFAAFALAKPQ